VAGLLYAGMDYLSVPVAGLVTDETDPSVNVAPAGC
jgi:hypothetical protein